jgi:hypothetical protein
VFAFIRLLPMSDTNKDIEILTPRHQLAMLQRHPAVSFGPPTSGRGELALKFAYPSAVTWDSTGVRAVPGLPAPGISSYR